MREEKTHLEMAERVLFGKQQLVPLLVWCRVFPKFRLELVPRVGEGAAFRADAPRQHRQELERARDLPAAEIAGGGAAPDVRGEAIAGSTDLMCDARDLLRGNSGLFFGEFRGELRVVLDKRLDESVESVEARVLLTVARLHVVLPIDPIVEEITVE